MLLGTTLIVLRETLEASLFVGVVAAATTHLAQRARWLGLGILAGLLGSFVLAASMDTLASWLDGLGQEVLTVLLLAVALGFLVWHALDAPRHSREAVSEAKRLGRAATADWHSMLALTLAVSLAVLREGAETVLFIAGSVQSGEAATGSVSTSVILGLGLGALVGWLLYRGLALIHPKRLFTVTNTLIMLLAGALASKLALALNQADWVTVGSQTAWDVSAWLSNESALGTLLHGLLGYDASPTQAQLFAYLVAVAFIAGASRWSSRQKGVTGWRPAATSG